MYSYSGMCILILNHTINNNIVIPKYIPIYTIFFREISFCLTTSIHFFNISILFSLFPRKNSFNALAFASYIRRFS